MLDIEQLLRDYSVRYNTRKDNVIAVNCSDIYPTCVSSKGSRTLTGAFLIGDSKVTYYCFRCGSKPLYNVLELITGKTGYDLQEIYQKYDKDFVIKQAPSRKPTSIVLPNGDTEPDDYYCEYISNRGFDPHYLSKKYDLRFTKHYVDDANARIMNPKMLVNRIVIPIKYKGRIVSWTSRTIDKNADIRYISCPGALEVINHKNILYNADNINANELFIVEGCFDVFRGGDNFCATFGIAWKPEQINAILETGVTKVKVVFDPGEPRAQNSAKKLALALSLFVDVKAIEIGDTDIGDATEATIKQLREQSTPRR